MSSSARPLTLAQPNASRACSPKPMPREIWRAPMPYSLILIDEPAPKVRRITLNRPEKRNALSNALRGEVLAALDEADQDDAIAVTIVRGAGKCFSAGYDISTDLAKDRPYLSAGGIGDWPRHLVEGYFRVWDLAKPVIAQVHGYCLA